jgi:CPA1 family monovalent cation:H+ antiporter
MEVFETLLGLIAVSIALRLLADRVKLPAASLLVLGGMGVAFVPGLPAFRLEPELALALFLPPLLQLSAYRTDWPAFKSNLRPILLLAIGAVVFSTMLVALVARWIEPGLPWWAAVALGAIVAPPDAVAASSVLKRFSLPKRVVTVLEGESLINDASSLVLYRFAVTAVAVGGASAGHGVWQFINTALGGMLIGWVTGRVAMWIFARIDNTLLDIAISLMAGFTAYLAADYFHASGVLGAVVCGLMLGRKQHAEFTAQTRLELNAVWDFVEFLLSSLVFMLIGLQLRGIVERIDAQNPGHLLWLALAVSATLVVSRFVWVFLGAWLPRVVSRKLRESDPLPPWTHQAVTSWAGMRGVVSMAAALALPFNFPGRDLIILLAFSAILFTLVVQGGTLGWLVDRLGVQEPAEQAAQRHDSVRTRAELTAASLDAVRSEASSGDNVGAAGQLLGEYEDKAERARAGQGDVDQKVDEHAALQRVRLSAIDAARSKLRERTDEIDAETHQALVHELDLEEQQVRKALGDT